MMTIDKLWHQLPTSDAGHWLLQ